jgi:hypothetical protein
MGGYGMKKKIYYWFSVDMTVTAPHSAFAASPR